MRYVYLAVIVLFSWNACKKQVVQKPVENQKDSFMYESSIREKNRQAAENKILENWLKTQADTDYQKSPYGYWLALVPSKKIDTTLNQDLDYVQYIKQYRNLEGDVIYNYEELGIQHLILGKTEEIRGIETALRGLSEGDKAQILLPSFMAYGLYGDDKKIGAHVPIVVELEVLKIKSKKN